MYQPVREKERFRLLKKGSPVVILIYTREISGEIHKIGHVTGAQQGQEQMTTDQRVHCKAAICKRSKPMYRLASLFIQKMGINP